MDKQNLKKILAGISVATLLTSAGMACATQSEQSDPQTKETAAPAQPQDTKAPGTEAPAPGS